MILPLVPGNRPILSLYMRFQIPFLVSSLDIGGLQANVWPFNYKGIVEVPISSVSKASPLSSGLQWPTPFTNPSAIPIHVILELSYSCTWTHFFCTQDSSTASKTA